MNHTPTDTVRTYLRHLHAGDTAGLIAYLAPDGLVHSPFPGTMVARGILANRAQASSQSVITLIDLFTTVQPGADVVRVAAYFHYDWTLSDGRVVDFRCVDVFGFKPGSLLIQDMQIVYDTHPLREQVGDKYAPDPKQA